MNNQWKSFLEARSGTFDEQGHVRFENAQVEAECALAGLSHLGLIAVSGADASDFLQGQLTNDVRELSPTHTQISSQCSPKGRMLSFFRVLRLDDTFYLQLPRARLEAVLQRLRMFVLRAQVTLEDASDRLISIGVAGSCAPSLLGRHTQSLPNAENDIVREGELLVMRMPGPTPRFQILGPEPAMEAIWDELAARTTLAAPDFWALLDIRAGIPSVHTETADAFIPQMANLQLIDGVSFTKGCYSGQEVIARMQYLGKLKRRMYLAKVETAAPPKPGHELYAPQSTSEQAAGRVVDARLNAAGDCELLAVLEITAAESGEVRLSADGPVLSLKEPPYGFPAEG
jgi:folate-binding protein YgfZ